jgi:hypothetical protein
LATSNEELLRKINILESRIHDLEQEETQLSHTVPRTVNPAFELDGMIRTLPALRGYWPMNQISYPTDANEFDCVALGASDLTGVNTTQMYSMTGSDQQVAAVYTGVAAGSMYHADAAQFDIRGNEANIHSDTRGLSMGGIVQLRDKFQTSPGRGIIGKYWTSGNNRSYLMWLNIGDDTIRFLVSTDGINNVVVTNTRTLVDNEWMWVAADWKPGVHLKLRVNGTVSTNTTSIPATIYNSTARFEIGTYNQSTSHRFDGMFSSMFLTASSLTGMWDYDADLWRLAKLVLPAIND